MSDAPVPNTPTASPEEDLLVQVAWAYYVAQQDQGDIAGHLGVSRATVSRILKRARERGIVQVSIESPYGLAVELSQALRERFRLQWVQVVPDWLASDDRMQSLAQAAALYLNRKIRDLNRLAVGWGRTISHVGTYAAGRGRGEVVEMVGTFSASSDRPSSLRLATSLARGYGMTATVLSAPAIAEDPETCRALKTHPQIASVLQRAREADLAVVSLGPADPSSTLAQLGLVATTELADLRRLGAVGEVLGRFFDRVGCPVSTELEDRLIGLTLEELRAIPRVMVVAGGPEKVEALGGALQGHLMSHLVVDEATAQQILKS